MEEGARLSPLQIMLPFPHPCQPHSPAPREVAQITKCIFLKTLRRPSVAGPRACAQAKRMSQESRFPEIRIPPQRRGRLSVPPLGQIWNLATSLTWVSSLRDSSKSGTYTSSPSGLPRRPRVLPAQRGRQHAGHGSARLTGGTFATAPRRHGEGGGGRRPGLSPSAAEPRVPLGGRKVSSASPTFSPRWRQRVQRRAPLNCTHAYHPTPPASRLPTGREEQRAPRLPFLFLVMNWGRGAWENEGDAGFGTGEVVLESSSSVVATKPVLFLIGSRKRPPVTSL